MSGIRDNCRHCELRGDMARCAVTECYNHDNWYATALRAALAAAERERDEARAAEEWLAFASMREERDALKAERNAALTLAENRGAAYDMTWREVESLRDRLDKEEEERGRQFGLRVQAETEVERLMSLVQAWYEGRAPDRRTHDVCRPTVLRRRPLPAHGLARRRR